MTHRDRMLTIVDRCLEHVHPAAAAQALPDGSLLPRERGEWAWFEAPRHRMEEVSARFRDALQANVLHLLADATMQQGRPAEAIVLATKASALSLDANQRLQLDGIRSASLRMVDLGGCRDAQVLTAAAIEETSRLSGAARQARRRHLHAAEVAPRLALGDLVGAERAAERSVELCSDGVEASESLLARARVAVAARRLDAAEQDVARAHELASDVPWLRGWALRVGATVVVEQGSYPAAQRAFALAFQALRGHGFQENLLLARLVALPTGAFDAEHFGAATMAHIARLVANRHRRHGLRPSECPTCRTLDLPGRAGHALGTLPGMPVPGSWST